MSLPWSHLQGCSIRLVLYRMVFVEGLIKGLRGDFLHCLVGYYFCYYCYCYFGLFDNFLRNVRIFHSCDMILVGNYFCFVLDCCYYYCCDYRSNFGCYCSGYYCYCGCYSNYDCYFGYCYCFDYYSSCDCCYYSSFGYCYYLYCRVGSAPAQLQILLLFLVRLLRALTC